MQRKETPCSQRFFSAVPAEPSILYTLRYYITSNLLTLRLVWNFCIQSESKIRENKPCRNPSL